MKVLSDPKYKVESAVINDALGFEGAKLIADDENAAIAELPSGLKKCLFRSEAHAERYRAAYGLDGHICVMGLPESASSVFVGAEQCVTFAYLEPMPPKAPQDISIKRLGPSLAELVSDKYTNRAGTYGKDEIEHLMRTRGVFGAIIDGRLAGFIGIHGEGSMGMLEIFDGFRRRGLGAALESFLIGYVMTFGRVPFCDVYLDNLPSLSLQAKLGLTRGHGITYWM